MPPRVGTVLPEMTGVEHRFDVQPEPLVVARGLGIVEPCLDRPMVDVNRLVAADEDVLKSHDMPEYLEERSLDTLRRCPCHRKATGRQARAHELEVFDGIKSTGVRASFTERVGLEDVERAIRVLDEEPAVAEDVLDAWILENGVEPGVPVSPADCLSVGAAA